MVPGGIHLICSYKYYFIMDQISVVNEIFLCQLHDIPLRIIDMGKHTYKLVIVYLQSGASLVWYVSSKNNLGACNNIKTTCVVKDSKNAAVLKELRIMNHCFGL